MGDFYTYLISSLPMLRFGMKAPFSPEELIGKCRDLIATQDIAILEGAFQVEHLEEHTGQEVLNKYRALLLILQKPTSTRQ